MNFTMNSYSTPICPKRSALQQLIPFTEKLLNGKNIKNDVDDGLLSKLQALGISDKLWTWLETYLKTQV